MNASPWGSVLRSPWPFVVLGVAILAILVTLAPLALTTAVVALVLAAALTWKFGLREGLWLLLVASIPYREPLSVDIHGTVSLFFSDVLLFILLADVAREHGFTRLWKLSPTFRVGLAVLALSLLGLYTASRLFWGVAAIYRIVGQLAVFYLCRTLVRSGREARRTVLAIVLGMVPAVAYGLYQASLPFGAELPDWAGTLVAYGPSGEPHLRVFSTFDHTLRFSHYLSVGLGLSLGLASSSRTFGRRLGLLLVGVGAAICNLFTYAVAGLLGMLASVVAALVLNRRHRAVVVLATLLMVAMIGLSPTILMSKAQRILAGRAITAAARVVTYKQAFDIMRDHPLTGAGWGSVRTFMEEEYRVTRAHAVAFAAENYFLQRGVALGLPGIALYIVLCILFFRNSLRPRGDPSDPHWPRAALIAGGVAYYLQAQAFPAASAPAGYLLWLLFALAEAMRDRDGDGSAVRAAQMTTDGSTARAE